MKSVNQLISLCLPRLSSHVSLPFCFAKWIYFFIQIKNEGFLRKRDNDGVCKFLAGIFTLVFLTIALGFSVYFENFENIFKFMHD